MSPAGQTRLLSPEAAVNGVWVSDKQHHAGFTICTLHVLLALQELTGALISSPGPRLSLSPSQLLGPSSNQSR